MQKDMDEDVLSDSERLIALYPDLDPEPDAVFPYVKALHNSSVRCICNIPYDDGATIQCDGCFVWQHMVCMAIDRSDIPPSYYCEACYPRWCNVPRAVEEQTEIQRLRRRERAEVIQEVLIERGLLNPPRAKENRRRKESFGNRGGAPSNNSGGTSRKKEGQQSAPASPKKVKTSKPLLAGGNSSFGVHSRDDNAQSPVMPLHGNSLNGNTASSYWSTSFMGNITQHGKRQRPADPYPDCPFPTLPPVDDWTRSFHGMPSGKLKTKSLPDDPLEAEYAQFALDCGITAALRFSSAAMENQVLEFLKEHQDSSKAPLFEQPPLVVKPLLSKDSGDQSVPSSTAMDTVVSEPEKKEIPVALAPVYQLPKEFISSLTPFYSVDTVSGPLDSASIPHFALFALANLPPAYFVCTVGGTLTTKLDMPSGLLNIKNISASTELLPPFTKTVVDSWILDSRLFAGPLQDGRFVRSSCSSETPPNARLVIFSVQNETLLNGCLVIGLVTTKEVSVGDEIVLECAEGWAAYPCACSDISCCLLAGEARDALTETLQMEIEERKEAQDEAAHQIAKERREARKQTEKLAKVKTPLPDFLRKIVLAHKKRQALRQRREALEDQVSEKERLKEKSKEQAREKADKEKERVDKDKTEQRDKERERDRIRQWAKEREKAEEKKLLKEKKGITIPLILPSLESMKNKAAASASRASSVTPVLTAQSPKEPPKSVPSVVSPRSMSREERKLAEELALFERMEREEKKTKHRTTRKRQQSGVPADADLKILKNDSFDSMSEIDAHDSSQMHLLGLYRRDSCEPDSLSSGQSIMDSEQLQTEEDAQSSELTKRKIESPVIETLLQEPVFKRPKVETNSLVEALELPSSRPPEDLAKISSIPPSSPMMASPDPMPETPSLETPSPVMATPAPMVRKLSLKELLQKRGKNNSSSNLVSPSGASPPSTPLLKDADAEKDGQEEDLKKDE